MKVLRDRNENKYRITSEHVNTLLDIKPLARSNASVTWDVSLRAAIPYENAARDVVDAWNYQVTAVTPQVLDFYVGAGDVCSIPVGVTKWGLTDPGVALLRV
ncbi:hypothetical protein ACJJTC_012434 [Scirpophaga incertulas]